MAGGVISVFGTHISLLQMQHGLLLGAVLRLLEIKTLLDIHQAQARHYRQLLACLANARIVSFSLSAAVGFIVGLLLV